MLPVFKEALVSPLPLFALTLLVLSRRPARRRVGIVAVVALYLVMTPWVGTSLLAWLEPPRQPLQASFNAGQQTTPPAADAVVVLGAGLSLQTPEWPAGESPKPWSLERLRYGVHLARLFQLPIVVAGGPFPQAEQTEAQAMADVLIREYGMPAQQVVQENQSRTTEQNAYFVALLAQQRQWDQVILVTQAYHMQRAVTAFERCGLVVVPAATGWRGHRAQQPFVLTDFLPSAAGLQATILAAHEGLGMLWYQIRRWAGVSTSCAAR